MGKQVSAWIIGLIIIVAVEIVLASMFFGQACAAPGIVQFLVLIAIPGVYVPLMILTLRNGGTAKT